MGPTKSKEVLVQATQEPAVVEAVGSIAVAETFDYERTLTNPGNAKTEEWAVRNEIAKDLGVSYGPVLRISELYRTRYPEWFVMRKNRKGRVLEHLHPDLVHLIKQEISPLDAPHDGEKTFNELASELGVSRHTIVKYVNEYREEQPEWIRIRRGKMGAPNEYITPILVEIIKNNVLGVPDADDRWVTHTALAQKSGRAGPTIKKIVDSSREKHPEWIEIRRHKNGNILEHIHHALAEIIMQGGSTALLSAQNGEKTAHTLHQETGIHDRTIQKIAEDFRAERPECFVIRRDAINRPREHYTPELIEEILRIAEIRSSEFLERQKAAEAQKFLNQDLQQFLEDIVDIETLEARQFQGLVQLFGAENVVDILFQYRPDYQKIDVPYVRRIIGEYLGEFLTIRGGLELEDLETGVGYLGSPSLKSGLTQVIKTDCLRFYNKLRLEDPAKDGLGIILSYIEDLRQQTQAYTTPELAEVIDDVESYYRSLFEIEKPPHLVDELKYGRLFPDLNQRINIKEIELKQKMLIADEMGVGKTASAILAKETLGVKQALIVVPSNVVEVWQKYLSDQRADNGDTEGYFKEGCAPNVLVIDSLKMLRDVNPTDYDYVILSQERLTDDYIEDLERFDYDMLVVDEVHKLKNIGHGKRADNLTKLAARIEEGSEEKYLALLSGTPVPNKVGDIAMLLKLLYPEKFEGVPNKELTHQIMQGDVLNLRSLLLPRMQMKSLAESIEMPQLREEIHEIEMSEQEKAVYEILIEEDEILASEKIQNLRQFLLNPISAQATPFIESTKIAEVGSALHKTFTTKDKVVMFVNGYVEDVIRGDNTIFAGLNLPDDVEVHVIHGEVSKNKRLEIQRMLHQNGRKVLLAVSGQTADVGVDFSGAEEVYFYNEPWTKYDKQQQNARVYRPGLKDDLVSHTFYVKGTIEEGIHKYIEVKYQAIEKLLRGIPLSELEQELLKQDEQQTAPNLEVNSSLAENYFTVWDKMMKIFGHVKEIGEPDFVKFQARYGREYAECYTELGSRSYQANANRLAGTIIDNLTRDKKQEPEFVRILDVASGPEMLRRHIGEEYQGQVVSVDINEHHFEEVDDKRRVGSFLDLPVADNTVDYANLALALHYTKFLPSKGIYERVEVLKELNRVLVNEGVAVITMMHTLDLKHREIFEKTVEKIGFKVMDKYSGETEGGQHFQSRVIALQKVRDCPKDTKSAVQAIGGLLAGLKLQKRPTKLRDTRKIVTSFLVGGKKIKVKLNQADQQVLEEEEAILAAMQRLKKHYKEVEKIPSEQIYSHNLTRANNGRNFVLFKKLETGSGAVITS